MGPKRVLSIQSHVAYGYVGGKAAVFPLQCLGFDVDVVNTVNFSNHSGYGRFGGTRTTAADLTVIFETMDVNKLLSQHRVLTGYIPGAEALSVISSWVKRMKDKSPNMVYLLDPVLGDSGRLYVAPDVIPIYRALLPHATIITPNWFEIETLTGVKLEDFSSLKKALQVLHTELGVRNVVMSSMPLKAFLNEALPDYLASSIRGRQQIDPDPEETTHLICLSSSRTSDMDHTEGADTSVIHAHVLPCIPGYFSGVGDLFSALVLAHFEPTARAGDDSQTTALSRAASLALSKTFAMLRRTHELCIQPIEGEDSLATDEERDKQDPERRVTRMRRRELRLIESQDIIRATPRLPPREESTAESNYAHEDSGFVRLRELKAWRTFWSQT